MRTVTVVLSGCDADTFIDVDVTDAEYDLLTRLAAQSVVESTEVCMPVLLLQEGDGREAPGALWHYNSTNPIDH